MARRGGVSICAAALFALLAFFGAARAEAQAVEVDGPLPCTRAELDAALALRVDVASLSGAVIVRAADGLVELSYGGRARRLSFEGIRGVAAARRIALTITDLVREERALGRVDGPVVEVITATVAAAPPAPAPRTTPLVRPVYVARPTTLDATAVAWVGVGSELERPALGLAAELSLHLVSIVRASVGVGVAWEPSASAGSVSVSMLAVPLRAGLGLRFDTIDVELRASGLVTPVFVSGADTSGDASRADLLGGVGLAADYRLRTVIDVVLMAGVDLTLNPMEYRAHALRALATDRIVVWVGAGLAMELIP